MARKCHCGQYLEIVRYAIAFRPYLKTNWLRISQAKDPFLARKRELDRWHMVYSAFRFGAIFDCFRERHQFFSTHEQNEGKRFGTLLIEAFWTCATIFSLEPGPRCRMMRHVSGTYYLRRFCSLSSIIQFKFASLTFIPPTKEPTLLLSVSHGFKKWTDLWLTLCLKSHSNYHWIAHLTLRESFVKNVSKPILDEKTWSYLWKGATKCFRSEIGLISGQQWKHNHWRVVTNILNDSLGIQDLNSQNSHTLLHPSPENRLTNSLIIISFIGNFWDC
jgi:hypothetical protein